MDPTYFAMRPAVNHQNVCRCQIFDMHDAKIFVALAVDFQLVVLANHKVRSKKSRNTSDAEISVIPVHTSRSDYIALHVLAQHDVVFKSHTSG